MFALVNHVGIVLAFFDLSADLAGIRSDVYVATAVATAVAGKRVSLVGKLAPWMLVMELKQVVQDVEGIPPDQQRLIFDGHQLDDMKSLKQCNIKNGDVVHLVLRLSGC